MSHGLFTPILEADSKWHKLIEAEQTQNQRRDNYRGEGTRRSQSYRLIMRGQIPVGTVWFLLLSVQARC